MKEEKYRQLKKEVEREMSHLRSLYSKLDKYEKKQKRKKGEESEEYGIKKIEVELKRKFPAMDFNKDLLRLVGALHYQNPASSLFLTSKCTTHVPGDVCSKSMKSMVSKVKRPAIAANYKFVSFL